MLALGAGAPACADTLHLVGARRASSPIVLLDGRRSQGCINNEIHRGRTRLPLENLLAGAECAQRVVVFSRSHAAIVDPEVSWTDAPRDRLSIVLEPRVMVPVHVWVLYNPCSEIDCTAAQRTWFQNRARNDLEKLDRLYGRLRAGISFAAAAIHERDSDSVARRAWDEDCTESGDLARKAAGHVAGALNVYYVRRIPTLGAWCEPDSILMSDRAHTETLAHEVGHALALAHTENVPEIGTDNLMLSIGPMDHLTLGQLFRANFDARSIVNRLGLRRGPTFDCDAPARGVCPALAVDYRPARY